MRNEIKFVLFSRQSLKSISNIIHVYKCILAPDYLYQYRNTKEKQKNNIFCSILGSVVRNKLLVELKEWLKPYQGCHFEIASSDQISSVERRQRNFIQFKIDLHQRLNSLMKRLIESRNWWQKKIKKRAKQTHKTLRYTKSETCVSPKIFLLELRKSYLIHLVKCCIQYCIYWIDWAVESWAIFPLVFSLVWINPCVATFVVISVFVFCWIVEHEIWTRCKNTGPMVSISKQKLTLAFPSNRFICCTSMSIPIIVNCIVQEISLYDKRWWF